jgi:ligand-binding sensor domain-containing protein
LFAYLLLFLLPASLAQPPYRFFSWTTENGLPQNSVQALLQTRDGYLWMSTLDGLVRFDGLRFRIFNRQNTPALTTNGFSFFALVEARQGCLWAGTLTGGAIRYCNGTFTSLTVKDGLPNNTVVRIDEDKEGTVWIFTAPGLGKWQNGRLIRVAPEPGSLGYNGRVAARIREAKLQDHRAECRSRKQSRKMGNRHRGDARPSSEFPDDRRPGAQNRKAL